MTSNERVSPTLSQVRAAVWKEISAHREYIQRELCERLNQQYWDVPDEIVKAYVNSFFFWVIYTLLKEVFERAEGDGEATVVPIEIVEDAIDAYLEYLEKSGALLEYSLGRS